MSNNLCAPERIIALLILFFLFLDILNQIRKAQKSTDLLTPKRPFVRIVRDITRDLIVTKNVDIAATAQTPVRFTDSALACLHEASEAYLVNFFEDSQAVVDHVQRQTLMKKDFALVHRLRQTRYVAKDPVIRAGTPGEQTILENKRKKWDDSVCTL